MHRPVAYVMIGPICVGTPSDMRSWIFISVIGRFHKCHITLIDRKGSGSTYGFLIPSISSTCLSQYPARFCFRSMMVSSRRNWATPAAVISPFCNYNLDGQMLGKMPILFRSFLRAKCRQISGFRTLSSL